MTQALWILTLICIFFGYTYQLEEEEINNSTNKDSQSAELKESESLIEEEVEADLFFDASPQNSNCIIYGYDFFSYLIRAEPILLKIRDSLKAFKLTDYIYNDFTEYLDKYVFKIDVKTQFREALTSCYRANGELFTITQEHDLEYLKEWEIKTLWQQGYRTPHAQTIIYPGNKPNLQFAKDNSQLKIPLEENKEKCKSFNVETLTYNQIDCNENDILVCEMRKTADLINIQYLSTYKQDLLVLINKIMNIGALDKIAIKSLMEGIDTDDKLCSGEEMDTVANLVGLKTFVEKTEKRTLDIREIASIGEGLFETLKFLTKMVEAMKNEDDFYNLIKYKLFKNLDLKMFTNEANNRMCGCPEKRKEIAEILFQDEVEETVGNTTFIFVTKKHDFFLDYRLVEILSILLSLVALLVSSCSVRRTAAKKHDDSKVPLYLNELQSIRSTSELNVALPTQLSRHKSLPNIKKVTIVEPETESSNSPSSMTPESVRFGGW